MRRLWIAAALALPLASALIGRSHAATAASPPEPSAAALVAIRAAEHTGFGRVVFDLPAGVSAQTVMEGSRVLVVFNADVRLSPPASLPRNVVSLLADARTVTLTLAQGAQALSMRLGGRLVFDIAEPAQHDDRTRHPGPETPQPRKPALDVKQSRKPDQSTPSPMPRPTTDETKATPVPKPEPPGAAETAPNLVPAPPPTTTGVTAGAPVQPVIATPLGVSAPPPSAAQPPSEPPVTRAVLPADTTVAAAAFRRGGWGVVVLDRRLPIAVPATLPGAALAAGETTTTLHVPLPPDRALALERTPDGWAVSIVDTPLSGHAAAAAAVQDGAAFPFTRPGRAVTILDPATGGALLVGTSLAAGPVQYVDAERQTPAFTILPTWLGVAVVPRSDSADLHLGPAGFMVRGGVMPPGPAPLVQPGQHLDLPNEAEPALLNRLSAQLASAASSLPRARTPGRLKAVEAMLALGLGAEAQAVTQAILADDPPAAADARLALVAGVSAVMAGRLNETAGLDSPVLADDPEAALWRGVRDRRLGKDSDDSRKLPASAALARSYPPNLRRAIWPDIAEAAAESGVPMPPGELTPFAAALALEHSGKPAEAIAAFQAVAAGPDRFDAMRATVRATELKLAAGSIGSAEAADEMERQSYAWRGDARELGMRLRAAELRSAAGNWRAALDLLRATDPIFPDQHDAILQRKTAAFEAMLAADGASMAPLDLVVTAATYADCLPANDAGGKLASLLADKLVALDLPNRAIPVLQGLVQATVAGPARAEFGARLAQLMLEANDPGGAAAALDVSQAPGLSAAQTEGRALLKARIQAAQGNVTAAVAGLETIGSTMADDLRASLLAQSGDWQGSADALSALAAKTVPESGPLSPVAQAVIIREASAAVKVGDAKALSALDRYLPRMAGPQADMLRLLTQTPITSTRELPRAAAELNLARAIPVHLQSLSGR